MKAVIGGAYEVDVDAHGWADEFGVPLADVQSDAARVINAQIRDALETYAAATGLITITRVGGVS